MTVLLWALPLCAFGQTLEDAERLNRQVIQLYQAGRYADAIPAAKEALQIRKKMLGEEHPDTANSMNNLAGLYQTTGAIDDRHRQLLNQLTTN